MFFQKNTARWINLRFVELPDERVHLRLTDPPRLGAHYKSRIDRLMNTMHDMLAHLSPDRKLDFGQRPALFVLHQFNGQICFGVDLLHSRLDALMLEFAPLPAVTSGHIAQGRCPPAGRLAARQSPRLSR